ncbi:TrkH family potassium uptake protein [Rikenella microfusus]|uniref:Trk system potassium uptake protein trkG n=1 Tax=Rikenella microfusus TaxID=28139 RepID=A0A379MRE3_9BACT|nr:TrkH family potassium uptake protein [Rikenella microfusus]SUE34294.1 Trk system potassium uptake protein trkG [Rikenella microfusus]HJE88671.1 TrkH family potassium uptake protein [Rikenella microfusus]
MKFGLVIRYVGLIMLLNAAFMLISAVISLFNGFDTGFYPLLLSFLITSIIGAFPLIFVPNDTNLSNKESYVVVIMAWIMSCLLGMLPYLIWGGEFTIANAWFESTSGFTTTGSTVLNDVEALPKGLLFWRASTHWIGGVGVVLFAIVILPSMGRLKTSLTSAEMSMMAKDNFRYTTKKILQIIIVVYVGLTLCETVALIAVGMDWFDALTHSFSTVATGGFSTKNLSIMYYDSLAIEMTTAFFMIVSGLHMGLVYATIRGKRNNLFRSEVARFYILSLAICTVIVSASLLLNHNYSTVGEALRYGVFQVASYTTTTGFASANDAFWPPLAMIVLIYCTMQCAMAGSSAGGIKADRVLLIFKAIKARVLKLQHPNAVIRIKQNGITQDDGMVNAAILLVVIYLLSALAGTVILAAMNIDLLTGFTASITSLSNVGPGFGKVSNLDNYGWMPDTAKWLLSGLMLFGRLEFFGFIHIFMLRSWK